MSREIDEENLNRYYDGELPEDKAELVKMVVESNPEEAARLKALSQVSEMVQIAGEDMAKGLDSDALFAAVKTGIEQQKAAGFGDGFEVIEGGGQERPVEGWKWSFPATAALAVAAAVTLFVFAQRDAAPDGPVAEVQPPAPSVTGGTEDPTVDDTVVVAEAPSGTEVIEVDFGESTGTVFAVQGASGEPLAVVWIDESLDT